MLAVDRRKSIIHIQNVFLVSPLQVYPIRQTSKYVIAYQPKVYREHHMVIKISKELISIPQSLIQVNKGIDINVREDYRLKIKSTDKSSNARMKNITMRIVPTRYGNLEPIYAKLYDFEWRHTSKGGTDELDFNIPECPIIANFNTIPNICYKLINRQVSGSGTHALNTYLILSLKRGTYKIGNLIKVSNETFHTYVYPVTITL